MKKANINPMAAMGGAPRLTSQQVKDAPFLECECGNKLFEEKLMFKVISPIVSPTGEEEITPIPVLVCTKCGKVPEVIGKAMKGMIPDEYISKTTKK